ncbi:MAG TPA: hypothetical protein P5279_09705 [Anaerohalosphaeraceae bacterium]|jgi:hypothetical protein|nr:hypothetical protein [Anaerohalosphaeraceae bacterium]HRT50757.1 hypothetical protein [Anaerohalosphaeraceae bacterium]HRT88399.1 hypothetical protein [Anaerohalosphaeraceae bacterium]
MQDEKQQWIRKYARIALQSWRNSNHPFEVSNEYLRQLEIDLARHYDDPLKRQFIEATWSR